MNNIYIIRKASMLTGVKERKPHWSGLVLRLLLQGRAADGWQSLVGQKKTFVSSTKTEWWIENGTG